MYVTTVHVHGKTDTQPGDTVQKEPPRGNVEERCRDLAPWCEPRPIEIGEAESSTRVIRDARDDGQRQLGSREIGGVDEEPIGETQEIRERPRAERRCPRPPEEDRQIRPEKRDERGRAAGGGAAARPDRERAVSH